MSWLLSLPVKKRRFFEKMDSLTLGKKNLFHDFVPLWQLIFYSGIVVYFTFTLLFLKEGQYQPHAIKAFLVLIEQPFISGSVVNPILNRGLNDGGHILAYLSLMGCALWARLKLRRNFEGFYYSILIPAFALSVSEGSFDLFYWTYYFPQWPHPSYDVFILTNPLAIAYIVILMIGIFVTPVWKFISRKRLLIALTAIYGYFALWIAIGLPVTLSSIQYFHTGNLDTVYYDNLWVNSTEIIQWFIASVCFGWATRTFQGKLTKVLPPKI